MKNQKTKYLNYFSDHKKLYKLKKKRSPVSMMILTDDPTGWFITVVYYQNIKEKVTDTFMILNSELEQRLEYWGRLGYEIVEKF